MDFSFRRLTALAMIFKLPVSPSETSRGSRQCYCCGVFCPLSAQGQLSGTRGTLPTHLPLPPMCEQAGEAAHRWDPAQLPPMLKERLRFGNGEGGAVGGLGET